MVPWLRAVIPAVITPFDADGKIDERALRAEIEHHLSCGVTALCAGGTTGEGAGLSRDEVKQLNAIFVDQAHGRVPVIAGIIPDTTNEAVELESAAKEAGVAALQVTPPHYLFQPGTPEIVSYYCEIRDRSGLGVILYNVLPWGRAGQPDCLVVRTGRRARMRGPSCSGHCKKPASRWRCPSSHDDLPKNAASPTETAGTISRRTAP